MADPEARSKARRGLAVFFAVVVLLSVLVEGAMIADGRPITEQSWLVLALMWSPAIAMVVARLVLREGVRDVSLRLGMRDRGWREWLLAWLYPVAAGGLAYGVAWAAGLAPFAAPDALRRMLGDLPVPALFASSLGIHLTIGALLGAITAAGEELGWRGYMLTRLVDAGVPRPLLVSGVIWGLWHMPLILSGQYAAGPHPVLSAVLFLLGISALGYAFGRVRLASGSVWPAVLFHASWNSVIQGTFDGFTAGHDPAHAGTVWVGESGIIVVAINVVFALLLVLMPFPLRRFPGDAEAPRANLRTL